MLRDPNFPQLDTLAGFFSDELPRAISGLASSIDEGRRETVSDLGVKLGRICNGYTHAEVILALMVLVNLTFEDQLRSVAAPTSKAVN